MFLKGALKKHNYLQRMQQTVSAKNARAFGSADV